MVRRIFWKIFSPASSAAYSLPTPNPSSYIASAITSVLIALITSVTISPSPLNRPLKNVENDNPTNNKASRWNTPENNKATPVLY